MQDNRAGFLYFCRVGKLYEIYKRNIYGVMGTLVFHILLLSVFLLAGIDRKGSVQEEELFIELPELITKPEIEEDQPEEQEQPEREPISAEASSRLSPVQNNRTNIASNRLAQNNEFFDDDYLNEVEEAKKLVSDVNTQLSKENINLEDIKMPVRTAEKMNPDSTGSTVFTGDSNIEYFLENRYHVSLPVPVYLTRRGGKVIVQIVVNRQGKVISAEPQKSTKVHDDQLYIYAKAAASRTLFNVDNNAQERQHGTIHYTFIAQ